MAVVAVASLLLVAGCSSSSLGPDATTACGWNESDEPVISALDADGRELLDNAQQASIRLEAAKRVAELDGRFGALVDALEQTAEFATELTTMSRSEIAAISNSRWDFAKYAQAVARDQCEQLAMVVESQ